MLVTVLVLSHPLCFPHRLKHINMEAIGAKHSRRRRLVQPGSLYLLHVQALLARLLARSLSLSLMLLKVYFCSVNRCTHVVWLHIFGRNGQLLTFFISSGSFLTSHSFTSDAIWLVSNIGNVCRGNRPHQLFTRDVVL